MTDIRAIANGDWSNPATWNGGTIPGPGDRAYSNTFTVTVDSDRTCTQVSNAAGGGGSVGGLFVLAAGVTLTADILGGATNGSSGTAAVVCSYSSPSSANIVGNITGGGSNNARGVDVTGTGILNVTGNIQSGGFSAYAIELWAACTLNVTGNVQSSLTSTSQAVFYGTGTTSATVVNITGNVTSPGTGSAANVIQGIAGCTITVNGTVSSGVGFGITNTGSNSVTIVNGPIYASATKNGVLANGSGCEVRTTGPCYNAIGTGMKSMMAVYCESVLLTPTAGLAWQFYEDDHATPVPLYYDAGLPDVPDAEDVRDGTVYGSGGALTGTLKVPPPGAVGLGVPTDNTTGTAVWTQQAIADAVAPTLLAVLGAP